MATVPTVFRSAMRSYAGLVPHTLRALAHALAVMLLAAALACKATPSDSAPGSSGTPSTEPVDTAHGSTHPLRVLFSGCDQAGPGPRCILTPTRRTLTLWVDVPSPQGVQVTIDGVPVDRSPQSAEEGWRWHLEIPVGSRELELRTPLGGREGRFTLRLAERAHYAPALLLAIERAAQRDRTHAREYLQRELHRWKGCDRVFADWIGGALAWRDLDRPAVERWYAEGIDRAEACQMWSLASRMARTLAFVCINTHDFACSHTLLERDATLLPFEDAEHQYLRGLLAENRGELGQALLDYQRALHDARALGEASVVELASLSQAMVTMARLGKREGARALMREGLERARDMNDRDRASALNIAAWVLLITEAEASPGPPSSALPSPTSLLEQAVDLLGDEPIGHNDPWFIVRLNLAYDALERGDPPAARRWLEALEAHRLSRPDDLWRQLLWARVDRQQWNHASARRRLTAMIASADRHEDHDLRWIARVDHAGVLEDLGLTTEALAEYREAEHVLETQLSFLGLGDRDRFMTDRDQATRRRVALLSARGEDPQALCVARLARTRVLRALHTRLRRNANPSQRRELDAYLGARLRLDGEYDDTFWEPDAAEAERRRREIQRQREDNQRQFEALMREQGESPAPIPDCASLPSPPPGTLDLHYIRLDEGWVGFAVNDRGEITRRALGPLGPLGTVGTVGTVGPLPDDDAWSAERMAPLAEALLGPFRALLRDAAQVRVMPTGPLYAVPFAALPFGEPGHVLQDGATVVYGLDLPRSPLLGPTTGPALVLEPPSNLPRAPDEARASAQSLRTRGLTVQHLRGEPASGSDPILSGQALAALPGASWLHYVGHARSDGIGGWDSELVLSGDGTMALGVSDILALPSAPRVVVLSGCETGVADPHSLGGGMSLAHAFLLAGSRVVVATTREIRDDDAVALMQDLYDGLGDAYSEPSEQAVPAALRIAQQRARTRDEADARPSAAWPLVRAWVP